MDSTPTSAKVAILGAGMAGLACARALTSRGREVVLLDKGRGVGGRMSSRRRDVARFDHGAQYFTVRTPELARVVQDLAREGVVEPFRQEPARSGEARWVGAPTMSAVPRALARGLTVCLEARATRLSRAGSVWRIELDGRPSLEASSVVVAIPAPQARDLLVASEAPVPEALSRVEVAPCWALMLEVDGDAAPPFAAARDTPPFSWICRQRGEGTSTCWIAHADVDFSVRHLELAPEEIAELLTPRLLRLIGATRAAHAVAHRWRFARTTRPAGLPAIEVIARSLVLAGDYCIGDRVEDAFTSGLVAAGLLAQA